MRKNSESENKSDMYSFFPWSLADRPNRVLMLGTPTLYIGVGLQL